MALSGSVTTAAYTTSSGGTRTVILEWTATQDIINNTSTITWTLKAGGTYTGYVQVSELRVTIDGTQQYYRSYSEHTNCFNGTSLASGSVTLTHDSSGAKTFDITVEAGIYNWAINKTGTDSFTLTTIDRTAPTVSHSTSNITSSGFKISATSNVTCDIWQYSIDGGSTYTQFSTTAGTSASITLSTLSANTSYSVRVRARKKTNQVYGVSTAAATKTLGASVLHSVSQVTADASTVSIVASITSYDSSFYHLLTIYNGTTPFFSHEVGTLTAGKADRTITLTAAQRNTILKNITSKTLAVTIRLTTYTTSAYSTQVGSASTCSCTLVTTQANSAPTFTGFSYSDTRTAVADVVGDAAKLLQTYSYLQVVCSEGTAKNQATIASYSVSIGGVSKTSTSTTLDVGTISKSGDLAITVTCTDSRGWATSVTGTITVLAYAKPKLTSYRLRRKDEVGELVQLSFSGSISSIKADGETNTNSLEYVGYYYKKTDEDSWSAWCSLKGSTTISGTTFSFSSEELLELDADSSYDFHIMVRDQIDSYSSYDLYLTLPQGTPIVALRKRNSTYNFPRVGINNPNPTEAVDVIGNVKMNGYLVLGYVGEVTDNFNNYKSGGYYHYAGSGASNAPGGAGILEVMVGTSEYLIQRFTEYASGAALYVRTLADGSWTAWSNK